MEWRWNNGLAFMNYKERVLTYLSDVVLLNNETEVTKMITKLYSIQSAISILQSDFQTIVDSSLLEKFHPTTRGVIKGFATGRINLDKMRAMMNQQNQDEKLEQNEELANLRADTSIEKTILSKTLPNAKDMGQGGVIIKRND